MKTFAHLSLAAAIVTSTFLFSCQKSSTDDLHDAQLCLNHATAGSAMGCVSKLSGNTTPLAYSLRCSAIFISQGFGDVSSFISALDQINGGSTGCTGGCSSTVSAISSLKFTAADVSTIAGRAANNDAAAEAFRQCANADAKIYIQIASLFRLGTMTSMLAYDLTGGGSYTQDQLAAQINNLTPADVGAVVSVTYAATCTDTTNASDSTKQYCAELKAAYDAGVSDAVIGECMQKKLNPSFVLSPGVTCP